jgi:hypothetical protein
LTSEKEKNVKLREREREERERERERDFIVDFLLKGASIFCICGSAGFTRVYIMYQAVVQLHSYG